MEHQGKLTTGRQLNELAEEDPPIEEESLIAMQFTADPYADRDKIELIQSGEAKLASLRLSPDSLAEGNDSGVYAIFCVFDDKLNKHDPAVYPTVDYMMQKSDHCIENKYTLPLNEVMEGVRSYDETPSGNEPLKRLPLSGMIFHEGFSGATLIANALATFDNTLVISEHAAIRDALNACDYIRNRFNSDDCSSSKHQKLIEDVVTLLSRSADSSIEHMYVKLDAASAVYLPLLRTIYPGAKWTFVHRKPEHVLAKSVGPKRNSCALTKRQPSSVMASKAAEYSLDLEELSTHEVCAFHLSTLLDVASHEHESTGTGLLISYEGDLLQEGFLLNTVIPYLGLQQEIDANPSSAQTRVDQVLSTKASVRGIHSHDVNSEWVQGSEEYVPVSEEVRAASLLFMQTIV